MPKFFVKENQIKDNKIYIINEDVNHVKNVLRMKKEDNIRICNEDSGKNYDTKITEIEKDKIICEIINQVDDIIKSNVKITIYQGLPKSDKMEQIIQKNTEIGVVKFVPVIMKRTIIKLEEKDKKKKQERWQKIAEIAAKQSMRDIIPKVDNITNIDNIKNDIKDYDLTLVAYENEKNIKLKDVLIELKRQKENTKIEEYKIAIIIGPEGGISEGEIKKLEENGSKIISLGNRILRTETAGIVMSSQIIYELEY